MRCAVFGETPDRQPYIVQSSGYYPFGMLFQSEQMQTSLAANANPYLYNGKEIQDMPGKWYDYGARYYDPSIGRWNVIDPAAEIVYMWTPYRYAFNNPVRYLDSDGQFELDNAQQYQRFAQYLQNVISKLLTNQRMMHAISGYGDLTYKQIAKDFTWHQGPKIIVVESLTSRGLSADGKYSHETPNVIYIDKALAMQLENASSADIDAALLRLISTLLHEYVHYGDWTADHEEKPYEAGYAFEEWVYGQIIGNLEDARKVLEKYMKRQKENQEQSEKDKEKNKKAMEDAKNLPEGEYKWDGEKWVSID